MDKRKNSMKDDKIRIAKLQGSIDKIFTDMKETHREMERYLREYTGKWWDEKETGDKSDSKVVINMLFSSVMTIAPLLTDNRPIWAVRARKPYMQKIADLYSLCLEYLWDKLEMDNKTFKQVLTSLVMKFGVWKVSFDPDSEFGGEVRLDIVDPRTYFCAPGYIDNWDAPFQGTRERKPLSWIRKNWPDRVEDIKPDDGDKQSPSFSFDKQQDYEVHSDFATVYEVWMRDDEVEKYDLKDKDGNPELDEEGKQKKGEREKYPYGKVVVFTKDVILEEKASPYRHNKPPYVLLEDYMIPTKLFGMGEGDQIENLNRSLNRTAQLIDKYIQQYCDPNWTVVSNAGIDVEVVKKTLPGGGNVYEYNPTVSQKPIQRLDMGNAPPELFTYLSVLMKVLEEITGVTDITKGMSQKTERQTAAEISTLIESSYTRTRQRVRNLEFSLKRVLYLMVDIMQQFYTETKDFNIKKDENIDYFQVSNQKPFMDDYMQPPEPSGGLGPQGEPQGKREEVEEYEKEKADYDAYKKAIKEFGKTDEVYADFDLTIETNSTLPMDKQSLANLFLRLLQMKAIDPEALLRQLDVPRWREIVTRMERKGKEMMKAKAGGGPPMPGLPRQVPKGVGDMMRPPQKEGL